MLSRGDRRLAPVLWETEKLTLRGFRRGAGPPRADGGGVPRRADRRARSQPWDIVESGVRPSFYRYELRLSEKERLGHRCPPGCEDCLTCGVCRATLESALVATDTSDSMIRHENAGLVYYTFESLDAFGEVVHGITARHGGVSTGPWASLNLTKGNGDDPGAGRGEPAPGRAPRLASPAPTWSAQTSATRPTPRESGAAAARPGPAQHRHAAHRRAGRAAPAALRGLHAGPALRPDGIARLPSSTAGGAGTVQGQCRPRSRRWSRHSAAARPTWSRASGRASGRAATRWATRWWRPSGRPSPEAERLLPRNGSTARRHFDLWSANRRWLRGGRRAPDRGGRDLHRLPHGRVLLLPGGKGRTGHFGALMMVHHA